jgi:predicted deacetylase
VTLLVIPARDLHPLAERSPQLRSWLVERRACGDAIAQHGFHHERLDSRAFVRRTIAGDRRRAAEFVGMNAQEAQRAVDAGWRLLKLAGVEPDGFVAPGYAYTRALRAALGPRFRWWATLMRLHRIGTHANADVADARAHVLAPAWGVSSDGRLRGAASPLLVRAGALMAPRTLRLDVHPSDLDHPRRMLALEWALRHSSRGREAITCEQLLAGESPAPTSSRPLATVHPLTIPSREA